MPKPVISVEHLTKQYDLGVISTGTLTRDLERWWARLRGQPDPYTRIGQKDAFERMGESILALDDVSFKVEQGEALGIIGKNGAGKSTLLKILSRVTAPTSGVVKVRGRIGSLLEVGTGFHPELTGRENVYLNGAILGMKKAEVTRKFDEIVDFSGVEKFIDTPVKRYSSGMYVRLAFAVAAHLDPEILIVDEVLAVGDAEFQKKCLGKMGDVAGEGRTVLFVSHNMAAIESLCRKTLFIDRGNIVKSGETKGIIESYISSLNIKNPDNKNFTGIIRNIKLINQNGKETSTSKVGEPLRFHINLRVIDEIQNPSIGVGINNSSGTRIFTVGTRYFDKPIGKIKGDTTIECSIDDNHLAPGVYFLKIAIGKSFSEDIEIIDNALQFSIEPADYFGNGRLPTTAQGFILIKSDWKIIDEG